MKQQRHIIKKQIIELNLTSQEGTFELQNEVSKIYQHKVIPLIDHVLSQFSSSESIYRINILEIDLGNIDINNLEQELIDKIIEKIQQQLPEKNPVANSSFFDETDVVETGKNPRKNQVISRDAIRNEVPSDQIRGTELTDKENSQLDIFSYFIQTGMLPWWSEKLSKQEIEEFCDRLITNSPNKIKYIVRHNLKNAKEMQRLIYQFSDATLLKIAGLFATDLVEFIADYCTDIKLIFHHLEQTKNISGTKLRLDKWQGIFFSLSPESNTKLSKHALVQANLLYIAANNGINYPDFLNNIVAQIDSLIREGNNFKSQIAKILAEIKIYRETPKINIQQEINSQQTTLTNPISAFSDTDEIYIDNAGLILLWPFLNRFFVKIGLVQENVFINIISAERAALLLQYLVDASTESSEHILPLNKILCGIDLLEPIYTHLEITAPERAECENLLSAVIQNWSILKNTSIEGFRKAFLQRNGMLRVRDGGWFLQIERETYDILLDRIPWGIRVIKLPWINNILYVEW